jgi:hypothetical protein
MATTKRRWVPIVAGIAVLLVFLGIGAAVVSVSWFRENVHVTRDTDEVAARQAFDERRRQFPDARPVLHIGDDRRPSYTPGIESRRNPGAVSAVHVMAWDANERALATATLPLWLLRMKSGPIVFGEYVAGFDDHGVRLSPEDLERYGPGVVFEFESARGNRVLLTAQ